MSGRGSGRRPNRVVALLRGIGPEVISGASDNDPTNVGTAAVVGAQTMYRLSWVALLVAPLLAVVLAIAAQVGLAGRADLQSLTLRRYGRRAAAVLMVSVVAVNVVTIAADVQAGAAGIGLLTGLDSRWIVVPLAIALVGLLLIGRYGQVVAILQYLLIGFAAFIAAAVLARPDWLAVLRASVVPVLSLQRYDVVGALALLGTTLTSYVYVWETIQRGVEEPARDTAPAAAGARRIAGAVTGGVFTAVILWSMLITSGATLGLRRRVPGSAQEAAQMLRPLAGLLASDLFAAGLVISAIVALPVLMASTAYVVGAQFDWRRGLSQPVGRARRFHVVLAGSLGLAIAVTLADVPVFSTLVAASIAGGLATPIGLVLLVRLARDPSVMGIRVISPGLALAGWVIAVGVGGLGALFLAWAAAGGSLT